MRPDVEGTSWGKVHQCDLLCESGPSAIVLFQDIYPFSQKRMEEKGWGWTNDIATVKNCEREFHLTQSFLYDKCILFASRNSIFIKEWGEYVGSFFHFLYRTSIKASRELFYMILRLRESVLFCYWLITWSRTNG